MGKKEKHGTGKWKYSSISALMLAMVLIALLALRPLAKKLRRGEPEPTNADRTVGKEGVGTAERLGKLPVFPGDDEGVGIDRVDEELAFGPALHLLGGTHQFEVSDSHFFANLAN